MCNNIANTEDLNFIYRIDPKYWTDNPDEMV